ncbi:hypothetical protein ACP275_08G240400 [Erythranthe tilingii]
MAMNSLISLISYFISIALFFLLSTSYCLIHNQPSHSLRGLVVAEKTRLGSRPPSCHNKCNQCHPCMAVQVPTLPSHNRVGPQEEVVMAAAAQLEYFDSSPAASGGGNRYSNYKPLGWKCRCDGHLFNP